MCSYFRDRTLGNRNAVTEVVSADSTGSGSPTTAPRPRPAAAPFSWTRTILVPLGIVGGAALARALMVQYFGAQLPYLSFFPAIIASAIFGGMTAGILATVLSAIAATIWLQPFENEWFGTPQDAIGMLVFLFVCVLVLLLIRQMHRAERRSALLAAQREEHLREREHLLQSERAARSSAERANALKDQFLATLSHELRTPLNAILGWTQLLRLPQTEEKEVSEGIETIERNARVQARIINDLLEMSRIISGKMRLDVQPVELAPVIEAAVETLRPAAEAKQIRIAIKPGARRMAVAADAARLQQVVWNLLSNAIKFTPNGGRVQVSVHRSGANVEFVVRDNGVGIDADFLPHLFDRFRQQEGAMSRRHGGLGLGLSIVKDLTELHRGTVEAMSAGKGHGATFVVRWPSVSAKASPSTAPDVSLCQELDLEGVRVLAVDDEKDAREVMRRFLTQSKAEVLLAASADEALRLATEKKPDIVVSDIGMPDKDGFELIRELRSLGGQIGKLPAIAVTAFARTEDRSKAMLAGYQVHIAKPVEAQELLAAVANLTSRTAVA
jgi:signal transduction histidine kinase/ActR/RegA family two-component response regulator